MKKANLAIIEKMPFDDVDAVQDVLFFAFHPEEPGENEPLDERYLALWTLFLASTGWTDQDYWAEWRSRPRRCPDCGSPLDKDGNHADDPEDGKTPPESKPN